MNYEEALIALDNGDKVKLPEWIGYWFKEDNTIKVYTRTSDIVSNPYLDDYKNRTDWEITNGLRDFGGALVAIKAGKKVARQGWNEKGMFIYLQEASTIHGARNPILDELTSIKGSVNIRAHIDMKAADDIITIGWNPSQADMLAEDWIIVN